MKSLWPIMLITFKEGIRNRIFYGISLVSLLLVGVNMVISSMIPQDVGKVAVDMALSTISFTGLLLVLFIGINLIARDTEKRTIYMILARPISRQQYIVGKFLGMSFLIIVALCILSLFACLSLFILKFMYATYFQSFNWPLVLLSIFLTMIMLNILAALCFLYASFTTSSFTTLMLTIISYIIGHSLGEVRTIVESAQTVGIAVSPTSVTAVRVAYYLFPNLSLFDIKTQAAHGIAVSGTYVFWVVLYGILYIVLAVTLAAVFFRKRELP